MASIFISHSSLDKGIAKQLSNDLKHYGHDVWLDEWEIKVGHCIPSEIERGIKNSDFVVLLLSPHAIQSNWVDKEWKSAYWDEVATSSIVVLPVLLEECEIPKLIQTKRYANFSDSYAVGFHELLSAIEWHSEAKGLTTSYEKSDLELPKIIRGSQELIVLNSTELLAKGNRMMGKPVAIKNARVHVILGSSGDFIHFTVIDNTNSYISCFVKQDSALEEIILKRPTGHFYGRIGRDPLDVHIENITGASSDNHFLEKPVFIVSEWEPLE